MKSQKKKIEETAQKIRAMAENGYDALAVANKLKMSLSTVEGWFRRLKVGPCPPGLDPEKWARQREIEAKNRQRETVGAGQIDQLANFGGGRRLSKSYRDAAADERKHKAAQ